MLVKQRRFNEAEPVLTDSLRVLRASGWTEGIAMIELQLARIQIEQGAFEAADQMLERVTSDLTQMGKPMYALEASVLRATSLSRAGDPVAALELLARASADKGASGPLLPTLACARATACVALGRFEEAEREVAVGLTDARTQGLPYEEAQLLLVRVGIARRRNESPDPHDAKAIENILASLGVRE
jgi:ATP/maltotriose-dependent transcriptional regulator MalT